MRSFIARFRVAARSAMLSSLFGVRDRRAFTSLYFTASLVTLLGMVGLGTDVGNWYFAKRQTQNVADAAALAGVMALSANAVTCASNSGTTIATKAANYAAARNGFSSGVTVNCPPKSGSQTTNNTAVEVYATMNAPQVFSTAFIGPVTIASRGVADNNTQSPPCVYLLGGQGYIANGSSDSMTLTNCSLLVNQSIMANSGTTIAGTGSSNIDYGVSYTNNGASVSPSPTKISNFPPDPYANRAAPTAATGSCTNEGPYNQAVTVTFPSGGNYCQMIFPGGSNVTLNPGTYAGMNFNGSATFTLNPGQYVFTNSVIAGNGVNMTGNGVSLYFTSGTLQLNGSDTANLTAMSTGNTAGMALWLASSNTSGFTVDSFATLTINGAIYSPTGGITLNGTDTLSTSDNCLQIVAQQLIQDSDIASNFTISGCSALGTSNAAVSGGSVMLVE